MLTSTFHSNFNGYSFFVYCLQLVVSNQTFPTRFDVFLKMGFPRLKPFLFTFPLSPPVCLCATIYTSNGCNFITFGNRPLHGFRRHLGCGAVAAKITANVWDIVQLSTPITP